MNLHPFTEESAPSYQDFFIEILLVDGSNLTHSCKQIQASADIPYVVVFIIDLFFSNNHEFTSNI